MTKLSLIMMITTSVSIADLFSTTAGNFTLGVNYWDIPFVGLVDELRIYSNAISSADVSALYNESK
tara:strand:+ start:1473 stop:1670 length:198 start_codon:yes stop_codon:yes gene_type:complete